ncbi:MAG: uncharacterized protein A8A55_2513 [Amphiamblys sp. WSBS2006]|nr:MAG: uncharacterized protein A8A55_2513 [Amphiamblys sp. WSBS2006]
MCENKTKQLSLPFQELRECEITLGKPFYCTIANGGGGFEVRVSRGCIPRLIYHLCLSDGTDCISDSHEDRISLEKKHGEDVVVRVDACFRDVPHRKENTPKTGTFNIAVEKTIVGVRASFFPVLLQILLALSALLLFRKKIRKAFARFAGIKTTE